MWADPLHLLRHDATTVERIAETRAHMAELGWVARPVWAWLTRAGWRNSTTAPWGAVYISAEVEAASLDTQACVLMHEATHARQMRGAGLLGRWAWALWYVLSPWHRRRVEVEAEAWEAACSAAIAGADATSGALAHHVSAGALGGWRWPHLTGGDPDELRADVAKLAAGLLARARAGGDDA